MFGIDDVTTPIFIITCIPINVVIPVANRLPNISGDFIAIKIPLQINIANSKITITQPIKPNSSANIENIKSLPEASRKWKRDISAWEITAESLFLLIKKYKGSTKIHFNFGNEDSRKIFINQINI